MFLVDRWRRIRTVRIGFPPAAVDTPDTDPENSEVEGHVMRIKAVEQPTDADVSEDGPEVQGHVVRRGAVDPPADGDDETASGDTESLARKY